MPLSEVWQIQPETDDNNTYALDVTFCGFKPDLKAGPTVYLGGQPFLWGTTACLSPDLINEYTESR